MPVRLATLTDWSYSLSTQDCMLPVLPSVDYQVKSKSHVINPGQPVQSRWWVVVLACSLIFHVYRSWLCLMSLTNEQKQKLANILSHGLRENEDIFISNDPSFNPFPATPFYSHQPVSVSWRPSSTLFLHDVYIHHGSSRHAIHDIYMPMAGERLNHSSFHKKRKKKNLLERFLHQL